MVKHKENKLYLLFTFISILISTISGRDYPSCTIISKDEKAGPTIKRDPNSKKWSFDLRLETRDCDGLDATIDIFYEREGNSILGQDYPTRIKIKNNQIKISYVFSKEEDFVFPSDNYYYRIEINPEFQSPSILENRKLDYIIFEKNFSIGTQEERQQFFSEYLEKLNSSVNLSNILFQQVTKSYFDKFMQIKTKFERGACEKFRKQKAQRAKELLAHTMRGGAISNIEETLETMNENERKCEAWQNNLDRNWLSFEKQENFTPATPEENQSPEEEIKDKVDKTIEVDNQMLTLLNSLKIMPDITKDTKVIEWMSLYYNAKEYIDALYSKKIVLLPHILESISELYEKLKSFTTCLKDILKDGSRTDLERWGNCPKDMQGNNIPARKNFLTVKFNDVVKNILQRIYEAKYPEDIRKLRKDLNESIENLYNFFVQIQEIIKERKPVPPTQAKHILEAYNNFKKYFDELKKSYEKGPIHPEYSEAYKQMNNDIIDNQIKLLDNFNETFNKYASNIKDFKGFPDSTENYIKAVADSLARLALHLKDSELNSILKKSWARIAPQYEPKKIQKIEVGGKPSNIVESIFDRAKGLVDGYVCTFKFEEDPQNPQKQQKRVDLDILLSELKASYSNNIKAVSDFILKQPYFNKVDDNTYLCDRKLSLLWIKEVIHDDSYDSLIIDSLQKYSEAILKITPPSDYAQYTQLDSLVVEIAQMYDIVTTKQERGLLLNQTIYEIKNITSKLLNDVNTSLLNLYISVENELKSAFDNANDLEKLNAISSTYTAKFSIENKDSKDTIEKKSIFIPYIALLIKSLTYIASTKDSDYIKTVLPYIDAKYLDNERREFIKTTLEKIGIEHFMPLQQFNDEYIQAIQLSNKEVSNIQERVDQLTDKIIKNAEKVNKEAAKTFAKALELAPENDKKLYKELELERTKLQIKNSIFCNVCDALKKIRAKIEEKINK